ncbi:lipopolysaccharide biosynthesis protein [Fervidobacterium thailandense]|uniref:Polysaccharide biosynthesis protein C-terminal domain-containing protein n=1 Tax=Fervidobacterium thailandense TaxID=1008305 RepID=A0A1E3G1T0_9BACT|nr:oligosaccharide flippase family protein [Fervidobacterium thailandense]ODN29813.1 hypothetical protein A4H02_08650 [Fervidobacterium thailandense]
MSRYRKLFTDTLILAAGNLGTKTVQFLLLPVITRYLSPKDLGKLDILSTTVLLIVPLFSLQIPEAVLRFTVEYTRNNVETTELLVSALVFSFFSAVPVFFLCLISSKLETFKNFGLFLFIIYVLSVLNTVLRQYIRGIDKVRVYVISDLLYSLSFAVSLVLLLKIFSLGLNGYLLSMVLAFSTSLLFVAPIVFVSVGWSKKLLPINTAILRQMLIYSLPLVPNGIMWWVITASDRYILRAFLGYEATGIYSVATKIPSLVTVFYSVFHQAWQVSSMEESSNQNYPKYFTMVFSAVQTYLFLGASMGLLILKPFLSVYINESYGESWKYVPFLLLGAVYQVFSGFFGVNYGNFKRTAGAFYSTFIAALVKITTFLFLLKPAGIQAASISTMLGYLSMWIIRIRHTKEIANVYIDSKLNIVCSILLTAQATSLTILGENSYIVQLAIFGALLGSVRRHLKALFALSFSYIRSVMKVK